MAAPPAVDRLVVVFPRGRGLPRWQERNRESPVPGRWPYGLDELAADGVSLRTEELDPPGRVARLIGPRPARRRGTETAVCWDEMTAVRLSAAGGYGRRFSGVIWSTDLVAGGAQTTQLRDQRRALRSMDGLWALSRPQVRIIQDWLGPQAPPVSFLRFGIDTAFYEATPYPGRRRIVSVGGDQHRDAATLFAAMEQVLTHRSDVECIVQSASPLPAPAGVTKVAQLPHDEVRRLLASADAVALATVPNVHVSGMTVALEAASCARPVVATSTPGMEDYVSAGVSGELVDPGDPNALAQRLIALLDDPGRAQAMGAAGRDGVERDHSTTQMCRALRAIVGVGGSAGADPAR